MALKIFTLNCMMEEPLYAIRMIQLASNFSRSFPVESNIVGHNLLKTEVALTFVPIPVSTLPLASTLAVDMLH